MDRRSSLALAWAAVLAFASPAAFGQGTGAGGDMGGAAPAGGTADQPPPATGTPAAEQVFITVIAEERDLRAVIREIERKAGVNIYVEPGIEEVVTVRLVNLPWRQVLEIVARDAGAEIEERGPRLFILSQPPRVSMEFADADIRTVLDLLARQAGKNIVIASDVNAQVNLNLNKVHWWRALETIVKTAGFVAVREGDDMIRIVRPSALQVQLTTKVYPLNYLRPPDDYKAIINERDNASGGASQSFFVQGVKPPAGINDFTLLASLKKMVTLPGESVEYNIESNSFIINGTDTKHAEIAALLKKIDVEPQQVFVDVKFITTSNNNFWRNGLRFGDPVNAPGQSGIRANLGTSGSQFPFSFGEGLDAFTEAFAVPAVLDFSQVSTVIQYVEVDNLSKFSQCPTLMTLNDREAVIFVGEKVPFAEQRATTDQNGNVQITLAEAGDSPVSVGFTLFITPHIVRDSDQIILTVIPRVTRLNGSEANGLERFSFADPRNPGLQTFIDLPRIAEQTVVTKLLVRDQMTAVIGGLMTETLTEVQQRTPILSSIPLIGKLFSWDQKDYIQENLIIFITPRIIRSGGEATEMFNRQYQIHQENDFFYQKYLKEKEGEGRHVPKGSKTAEKSEPATEPLGSEPPPGGEPPVTPNGTTGTAEPTGEPTAPGGTTPGGTTPSPTGEPTTPSPTGEPTTTPPGTTTEPTTPSPSGGPTTPSSPTGTPSPAPAGEPGTTPPAGETTPGSSPQPPGGQAFRPTHEQENADQCRRA